eukprot:m.2821 g.2821  ORF g.2821 m.2821 type:complete len:815 (+) comp8926_c0_seq1:165-2609(+)
MSKAVDPEFRSMKGCTEMTIFRIEKMKVVRLDKVGHGYFHTGDSYILYSLDKYKQPHIHFWLGKETSQDEAGVAAYKTVELDDFLGGYPVQHREVQFHESAQFLSYFSSGVKYLEGGVDTGFKKVDLPNQYRVRLLQVKGRRHVRVYEVPKEAASLNKGDVFVLDTYQQIYVWNGSQSSRLERAKGVEVARSIRDTEHAGRAQIHIFDEDGSHVETFYKVLGSKESKIKVSEATTDEDAFSRSNQARPVLYKVSDASGKLEVTEVSKAPLKQAMLDENDCFILDYGISGIFAWIGKKATKAERDAAMKTAQGFIKEKGYPNHIPVTRIVQKGEVSVFKQAFTDWMDHGEVGPGGLLYPKGKKSKNVTTKEEKFDAAAMHEKAKSEPIKLVDDGSGKVEIWRIENFEMEPLDRKLYGNFFAGDSYVILYTYLVEGVEHYIVYFWLGKDSSQDEIGAAAIHATSLDDKYGGRPVQVRVTMHKEPEHFLRMFKGQMVIHSGGKASGFKNRGDKDSYDVDGTRLFHVRGLSPHTTKAVQVDETASSLNSNDCFVLETPKATYLWYGKGCSGDERELANSLAGSISTGREATKVLEEKEPADFWEGLGGKGEYASAKALQQELPERPPRLFQCSNASGRFRVEELPDFVQDDLEEDDVMILDTYDEVFVWIGKGANSEERKKALDTAKDYVKTDPSGRDLDSTVLYQIKQGFEPPTFTCWFHAWDPKRSPPSEDDARAALEKENAGVCLVDEELAKYDLKFTFEELKKPMEQLPTGVDPYSRERHLKDEEFPKAFGISREDYEKLPQWKRTKLKKSAGF